MEGWRGGGLEGWRGEGGGGFGPGPGPGPAQAWAQVPGPALVRGPWSHVPGRALHLGSAPRPCAGPGPLAYPWARLQRSAQTQALP